MAYIQKDRVKETTTITGTGNIALLGAVAGFQAFSSVMSVADTCYYVIVSATGTDWETGTGTYSAASVLTRTTVLSSSNSGNAVSFTSGTKDVFMGPVANQVYDIAHGGTGAITAAAARTNLGLVIGTDVLAPNGSGASLTSLTAANISAGTAGISVTGNAATVTTNANLTGHVTSVGNAAVLGSFTSAQLAAALSDETGTGAAVFATSPTLVTPLSNTLSAIPVTVTSVGNALAVSAGDAYTTGAGGTLTLKAGSGAGVGAGGNAEMIPGLQGTSGGNGRNYLRTGSASNTNPSSNVVAYSVGYQFNVGPDESNDTIGLQTHNVYDYVFNVRNRSTSTARQNTAAFFTSNTKKTAVLLGSSLSEATVSASWGASGTAIDLVLISITAAGSYVDNLRLLSTGETRVIGFLTAPYVRTTVYTVATLPAAATAGAGARAFVSDANATTFAAIVAAGGANGVPVYSDGTDWRIG